MLGALTTHCHHSRYVWHITCRNVYTISLYEIGTLEPEQIKAFELRLTGRNVLTILPTGYRKSWIYQGFFDKAFRFEPECERISDFAAYKHFVNSIAGEQFWNMNWLNLAFLPSIWTIKPDFNLKLSAAIGKHVTTVGWSPMSNT